MTPPRLHAYNRADAAQENDYDKMIGGGAEEQYNTRDALTARRKKKKDSLSFLMEDDMLNSSIFDNRFDDFGHARARRGRGDVDGRKRIADGDQRRIATDEDGKRVIVDNDGRIATDKDGNRVTLDDDTGHRVADGGDGSRVIVDSKNRVLMDEGGKPIKVNADSELIITTEPDGARVAVTADGNERLAMRDHAAPAVNQLAESRTAVPGADLDTVRNPTPVIAGTPEAEMLARDFSRVESTSTTRFSSFLAEGGISLDEFQKSVQAVAADGAQVPRGADIDIPHERLNVGNVRSGRFLRMVTPNGFDVAIPVLIGAGVGGVAGAAAGAKDGVTLNENGVDSDFNWTSFGETALKTGGYTALDVGMFTGTGVAMYEGRKSEATVRAIEDGIEIASPFVMAGAGAALGAGAGGVGAIPGAIIGFLAGSVVTIFASDITRSIARGLGYEDVDRGMIGSFIAPEYMEEMESWVSQFSKDGEGWRGDESIAEVLERIEEGADSPLERAQNFRNFMGKIVEGIDATQRQDIEAFAERIEADTGLEGADNIVNALRIPAARNQILAFYRDELAQNPQDTELGDMVSMIETFEASEAERLNAIAAVAGGETMVAREANEELGELIDDTRLRGAGSRTVREELAALGYGERMQAILDRLEISEDTKVSEVVARNLANGTDAYAELGTRQAMFESYALMVDVEDQLTARQNAFVAQNWDEISQAMMMSNDIDRPWYSFSSDTTLGAALQDALDDAEPGNPAAEELRSLLAQTDNLENMSPEMAAKLLDNPIFREAFLEAIKDEPGLHDTIRNSNFQARAKTIDEARATMQRLQAAGSKYGFTLETVPAEEIAPEAAATHAPNRAYAIPRAPAPAPAAF